MTGTIEKSAKLSDVARAAGVSQGTVSNVFYSVKYSSAT